jgi:hypothetical protein
MGARSTLYIGRRKAMERLAEHRFSGMSNADLETWFNWVLDGDLYEVCVSREDGPDDDHPAIAGIG